MYHVYALDGNWSVKSTTFRDFDTANRAFVIESGRMWDKGYTRVELRHGFAMVRSAIRPL